MVGIYDNIVLDFRCFRTIMTAYRTNTQHEGMNTMKTITMNQANVLEFVHRNGNNGIGFQDGRTVHSLYKAGLIIKPEYIPGIGIGKTYVSDAGYEALALYAESNAAAWSKEVAEWAAMGLETDSTQWQVDAANAKAAAWRALKAGK